MKCQSEMLHLLSILSRVNFYINDFSLECFLQKPNNMPNMHTFPRKNSRKQTVAFCFLYSTKISGAVGKGNVLLSKIAGPRSARLKVKWTLAFLSWTWKVWQRPCQNSTEFRWFLAGCIVFYAFISSILLGSAFIQCHIYLWNCVSVCLSVPLFSIHSAKPVCTRLCRLPKQLLGRFQYLTQNSTTLQSGWNGSLSSSGWRKVWTGVKCYFPSAQLHEAYAVRQLSISWDQVWNFTRIGHKTTKWRLSKIQAWGRSDWHGCDNPEKMWTTTFLRQISTSHVIAKLSTREAQICSFSWIGRKINKLRLWKDLSRKLRNVFTFWTWSMCI